MCTTPHRHASRCNLNALRATSASSVWSEGARGLWLQTYLWRPLCERALFVCGGGKYAVMDTRARAATQKYATRILMHCGKFEHMYDGIVFEFLEYV